MSIYNRHHWALCCGQQTIAFRRSRYLNMHVCKIFCQKALDKIAEQNLTGNYLKNTQTGFRAI